jgi:hypothetical protein
MKVITKSAYIALLVLGIVIGALTVIFLNDVGFIGAEDLAISVAVLALASGILAGLISTISPSQKWTRLRGAALAIECEVWRYRTRSGTSLSLAHSFELLEMSECTILFLGLCKT